MPATEVVCLWPDCRRFCGNPCPHEDQLTERRGSPVRRFESALLIAGALAVAITGHAHAARRAPTPRAPHVTADQIHLCEIVKRFALQIGVAELERMAREQGLTHDQLDAARRCLAS